MPPKPLAEDLARKKAERDKAKQAQEMLAILESPSGFEQTVNAIKDPVGTVKQLGRVAKETFYDPIKGLGDAFNPFIKQKPIDRVNKALGGALTAADLVTPFVPEGTIVNSLRREAMERVMDDAVARYAASPSSQIHHRTALGVHGSPKSGLTEIKPFAGTPFAPDQTLAFAYDPVVPTTRIGNHAGPAEYTIANPGSYAWNDLINKYAEDLMRKGFSPIDFVRGRFSGAGVQQEILRQIAAGELKEEIPTIYFARFPRASRVHQQTGFSTYSEPGSVVSSVPVNATAREFRAAQYAAMTPAERRAARAAELENQFKRADTARYERSDKSDF